MPGCETRLSVYNSRDLCAEHDFAPHIYLSVHR